MNLNTLAQGDSWMTPEERQLNRDFVQSTAKRLAIQGLPETPLVVIRVNDVIATWLLARRLEAVLVPLPGEAAPCPTPAQAGAIGRCRDRLRRAMKDLEACYARVAGRAREDDGEERAPTMESLSVPTIGSSTQIPSHSKTTANNPDDRVDPQARHNIKTDTNIKEKHIERCNIEHADCREAQPANQPKQTKENTQEQKPIQTSSFGTLTGPAPLRTSKKRLRKKRGIPIGTRPT